MPTPIQRCRLPALLVLLAALAVPAQPAEPEPPPVPADSLEFVTTEAVTVAGHEFCRHFLAAWRDLPGSEAYSLHLVERPSARRGSTLAVQSRQRRLLLLQLPPNRAPLAALAASAAEEAMQAVRESSIAPDADLAADEI